MFGDTLWNEGITHCNISHRVFDLEARMKSMWDNPEDKFNCYRFRYCGFNIDL